LSENDKIVENLIEIRSKICDLQIFRKKSHSEEYNEGLIDSLLVIDSHIERLQEQDISEI
jgi:hypothetical protein